MTSNAETAGVSQVADGDALLAEFDQLMESPANVVPSPWDRVNRALHGGGRRGDTTVLGAWSSHGKSLIGAQWVETIGDLDGHAGIYTNEMSRVDLTARLVAGRCSVPFALVMGEIAKPGTLTTSQRNEVRDTIRRLPVKIVQCSGKPWPDIARHMRRQRWDITFLDLFHRLPGIPLVQDIDAAIAGLCDAAVQTNCHLIVASQLNQTRATDRKRPPPTGRDLRGSGQLFMAPANVLFIHQEQATTDKDVEGEQDEIWYPTGRGMLWLDKARNGPPGPDTAERVTLDEHRMRFDHGDAWRGRQYLEAAA